MSALAVAAFALLAAGPLDDARRHYQRLEYDQALALLESARRQAGTDAPALAQVWLLEGFVQLALGRSGEGAAALRRAVKLDPKLALPIETSPKLAAAFEQARREEAERAARRSAVRVHDATAEPPKVAQRGIEVAARVDAAYAGLDVRLAVSDPSSGAQATLPMVGGPSGRFSARVPAELAQPGAKLQLSIDAVEEGERVGTGAKLEVVVPKHRAAIAVSSPHDGAEVTVDGAVAGATPFADALPVEPGTRQLMLRAPHGEVSQQLVVQPGEIAAVTLSIAAGPSRRTRAGIGLVISGGLALVGSVVFAVLTNVEARRLEAAVRREPGSSWPLTDFDTVRGSERAGQSYSILGIVSAVIGAAAVGLGGFLWLGDAR